VAHHLQIRGPPIASKLQRLDSEKIVALWVEDVLEGD
jgi:hypothetical protein